MGKSVNAVTGSSGNDVLGGTAGVDKLDGGDGNDVLVGMGSGDQLFGGAGNDILQGGDGKDLLDGGDGNDRIIGGKSGDTMLGGAGDDTFIGGNGHDVETGGTGADTFVFDPTSAGKGGNDTVTDFNAAEGDRLDFQGLLTGFDPLTSALSDFVHLTTDAKGNTTVSVDANGAAGGSHFVTVATLEGVTGLDAAAMLASGQLIVN